MGAVRVVVDDVDEALVAFAAAAASAALSADDARCAAVRAVLEVEEAEPTVRDLIAASWELAGEPVSGPGGGQQLPRRGPIFLEVFAGS